MTHTIAPPTLEELNERISALEELRNSYHGHRVQDAFDVELYCLYAVRDGAHVDARQIVREEWHQAVKEFSLRPGTQTETVIGRIINRLDSVCVQSPWMDIETAPKDGKRILLSEEQQQVVGYWAVNICTWICDWNHEEIPWQSTHWMPLPAPPTQSSPPDSRSSHNHGDGDPSVIPDLSGGEL